MFDQLIGSFKKKMIVNHLIFLIVFLVFVVKSNTGEIERELWYEAAKNAIHQRLTYRNNNEEKNNEVARNVILIIGDGMGPSTLTAARILRGQRLSYAGEESELSWDTFPAVALARTYNTNAQIGESSACATALSSGIKANFETLGLDSSSHFENCFSSFNSRVPSIMSWAQEQGMSTGIVTNTRLTHATPAAFYAHSASRYWEDDSKLPTLARKLCKDIARQLIENEPGRNINVLLGGGRRHFVPTIVNDPDTPHKEGRRLDGKNLISDWIRYKKSQNISAEYVTNAKELSNVDVKNVDYLMGLFSYSHMDFNTDREKSTSDNPSLDEMTATALKILQKNYKGYFLVVEGGRIDHAHHYNNAFRALDETLVLDDTVKMILETVNLTETLVVVTSDHSHVLTFGGFGTTKGNSIFGFDTKVSDVDNLPYTTLLYTTGPGSTNSRKVKVSPGKYRDIIQTAAVPRNWAAHGGEDVPVYAIGPLDTRLFSGSVDQSYIPHAIAYIACLGPYKERCACTNNCHPKSTVVKSNLCQDDIQCYNFTSDNSLLGKPSYLVFNEAHKLNYLNVISLYFLYFSVYMLMN